MKRNSKRAGEEFPESHHAMPLCVGEEIFTVVAAEETGQRHPQLTEAQLTQIVAVSMALTSPSLTCGRRRCSSPAACWAPAAAGCWGCTGV